MSWGMRAVLVALGVLLCVDVVSGKPAAAWPGQGRPGPSLCERTGCACDESCPRCRAGACCCAGARAEAANRWLTLVAPRCGDASQAPAAGTVTQKAPPPTPLRIAAPRLTPCARMRLDQPPISAEARPPDTPPPRRAPRRT